jgi:hypothetical protein
MKQRKLAVVDDGDDRYGTCTVPATSNARHGRARRC